MKIDQIILENFGFYARKTFKFNSAPLVLIYGPNESGKTTALNGIRQALCGFRMRTPYLISGRTMTAEVRGQLADGRVLEFTRRKGRQDEISGSLDAKRLQPEDVRGLLCDLDLDSYEQLFGFSLDELRKGESALKSLRLTDALAGGGLLGMTALQKLRGELEQSLSELYKVRGSVSRINVKLSEIDDSQAALRQVQVLPSRVTELRDQLLVQQQHSEQLKHQYTEIYQRASLIRRTLAALPTYHERARVQRQLNSIDIPSGIDVAFVARWTEHADEHQRIAAKIEITQRELKREEHELASMPSDGGLLDFELDIDRLGHRAGEIAAERKHLIELQNQYEDASQRCGQLLESLELPTVTAEVRKFAISTPASKELELLSSRFVELGDERVALSAKLDAANDTLASIEGGLAAESPPGNLAQLVCGVARLKDIEQDFARKSQELQQLVDDPQLAQLKQRLCQQLDAAGGIRQLDARWPVPSAEALAAHGQAWETVEREVQQVGKRLENLETQSAACLQELRQLVDGQTATADLARWEILCQQRDELLAAWLDELTEPLIAAGITVELQSQRLLQLQGLILEADELQAQLRTQADALAAADQKRQQLSQLRLEVEREQLARAQLHDRRQQLQASWSGMWKGCPLSVQSIAVMTAWQQDFTRWIEQSSKLDQARREAHIARGLVRQARVELQDMWPINFREDIPTDALLESVRGWEAAMRDAARDRSRLATARRNVEIFRRRLDELEAKREELLGRYERWLANAPVTRWPLEQLQVLLENIEQLRREDARATRLQQQTSEIRDALAEYQSEVRSLSVKLKAAAPASSEEGRVDTENMEVEAGRWLHRLQQNRQQRSQRASLSASIGHRKRELLGLQAQADVLNQKLAALCATAGSTDRHAMDELMHRVSSAERLRTQLSELSAALEAHAAGTGVATFMNQLATADETALQLEEQELQRQLAGLDDARRLADETVGSLTQQVDHLANDQAASRQLQQLHSQRGELAELAEQWAVERLAQELLARSIERFAADNEPELLQFSRQYLEKLTGGRYTSIEHDSSNPGSFIVRNAGEECVEPQRLSTGTREQLYLAIRMAFIRHHCLQHEPMPVIMDDCFVNFDDQRTRLALEAIANWDDSMQTILLSCHLRLVEFLATVAPATPVVQLENDYVTTAAALLDSLPRPTVATPV